MCYTVYNHDLYILSSSTGEQAGSGPVINGVMLFAGHLADVVQAIAEPIVQDLVAAAQAGPVIKGVMLFAGHLADVVQAIAEPIVQDLVAGPSWARDQWRHALRRPPRRRGAGDR